MFFTRPLLLLLTSLTSLASTNPISPTSSQVDAIPIPIPASAPIWLPQDSPLLWNNATFTILLPASSSNRERLSAILGFCQTGPNSPKVPNAVTAVNWLAGRNRMCINDSGAQCTMMGYHNMAHLGVCGTVGWGIWCADVATSYHQKLIQVCQKNGRAQGYVRYVYNGLAGRVADFNLY